MHLKSLELFGFKTFSRKTVIDFPHGFMAVVGPNGSGKSNLTDAIRFCLGDSGVKALRATKLDELIFAGTPERPPAPYAEVTAVFCNADGRLPVDLAEVAITRRLSRDGGSKFAINGTTCRLKDVHEMLMGSGIGPGSFSVLGGKEVDRVLSSDPKDRRMMLEETASVNRYRLRKKEAKQKLEQTEDNLVRLRDILGEVGEQLEESKKQLQRYERYRASKEELGLLERQVALHEVTEMRAKVERLSQQLATAEGALDEARVRENAARSALDGIAVEKEFADREREKLSATLSALRERASGTEVAKRTLADRRKQLEQSLDHSEQQLHTGADRVDAQLAHLGSLSERRTELNSELDRARAHLQVMLEELVRLPEEAGGPEAVELKLQRENLVARQQRLREEETQDLAQAHGDSDRKEELAFRRSELLESDGQREPSSESVEFFDLDALEAGHEEVKEKLERLKEQRHRLQAELEEQIVNGRELEAHRRPMVGRIAELEALALDRSSLPPAVRAVMRWNAPGVVGLLGELIKVPEGLEAAFEAALGGAMNNILTRDRETASELVGRLKAERLGRATFWPLDLSRRDPRRPDLPGRQGVVGWALDLLDYPKEIESVLAQVLGRTAIMESMPSALSLYERCSGSRPHLVTRGGEYLNPSGALTGGSQRSDRSSLLAARGKLHQAKQDLAELERASVRIVSRIEKIQNRLQETEQAITRRQEKLEELAATLTRGRVRDREAARQKERLASEQARLDTDLEKLHQREQERRERRVERERQESAIQEALQEVQARLLAFSRQQDELSQRRDSLIRERMQAEMRVERAQERLADLERESRREEERLQDLRGDRSRSEQDLARAREGLEALAGEAARLEQEATDLIDRVERMTVQLKEVRLSHQAIDQKAEGLRQEYARASSTAAKESSELHRLELEKARTATQYEEALERIKDGRSETEQLLLNAERTEPLSPEQLIGAKARIGRLRHFLDNFGGVNLGAREDFERLSERYSGLDTQIRDLTEGKESLRTIMKELDRATTELFLETFERVNDTFGRLFSDLFGGGRAQLVLCDPEDSLDSGVEIMACPPGKKQQNMMLMSSGERALSAIAFLMALLACKPSPIVILDELDAPLDERNVEKVATRLLEFSTSSQFLVVTHNRKTMEFADRLYGVTMVEPGISQVLSVELAQVEEKLGSLG